MKQAFLLILAMLASSSGWCGGDRFTLLQQEAEKIAQEFVGTLKPQLLNAMQQGGPEEAVKICAKVAPQISMQLSSDSGWQVKRVSLRARNTSTAIPDSWEKTVLEEFDQRHASGETAVALSATIQTDNEFRYMKAQGVGPLCLTCHGDAVADNVKQVLKTYYPDDRATGYRLGEIRGAISLTRPL